MVDKNKSARIIIFYLDKSQYKFQQEHLNNFYNLKQRIEICRFEGVVLVLNHSKKTHSAGNHVIRCAYVTYF